MAIRSQNLALKAGISTESAHRSVTTDAAPAGIPLIGITLLLGALFAFGTLLYHIPTSHSIFWGNNPPGAWQFGAQYFSHRVAEISQAQYRVRFQVLLLLAWAGYAWVIASGWRHGLRADRWLLPVIAAAAILFAVWCPPALSTDAYAYASYARLNVLYSQNPYFCRPQFLANIGDASTPYLYWNLLTPYGSVWTGMTIAVVALLRGAGLWGQVLGIKLLEAAALIVSALAGRKIAEHYAPGRGSLTLLAIGLNPLFLIEGPGNGHNDLLTMSLILMGMACHLERKHGIASLCFGLSIGIKLIAAALLPWLLIERCKVLRPQEKVRAIMSTFALALLPIVLCYMPFWHGLATLAPLLERSQIFTSTALLTQDALISHWLANHGGTGAALPLLLALLRQWPIIVIYGVLSLWIRRSKVPGRWLTAWAILAFSLMFWTLGVPFPWYISWFWIVCLTRWDRLHRGLSVACFGLALVWECMYTCLTPI